MTVAEDMKTLSAVIGLVDDFTTVPLILISVPELELLISR